MASLFILLARVKHDSLLARSISDEEREFYTIDTWSLYYRRSTIIINNVI
jgi:hypothetical protein